MTAPVLPVLGLEAPLFAVTDASGYGIGAILLQENWAQPVRPERPIISQLQSLYLCRLDPVDFQRSPFGSW